MDQEQSEPLRTSQHAQCMKATDSIKSTFEVSEETKESDWSRTKIIKNLVCLSLGIFLVLSTVIPATELQSSLTLGNGVGAYSFPVSTAIQIVPSILLTPYLPKRYGLKPCMIGALIVASISYFGNYCPGWYSILPSAVILHLAVTPVKVANLTYLTYLAEKYSKLAGTEIQGINNLFHGMYFFSGNCGLVCGSYLLYYLLQTRKETRIPEICGFGFCDGQSNVNNNTDYERPPNDQVYLLFGIFVAISAMAALLLFLFLDDIKIFKTHKATWSRALDSLRLWKRWDQICMSIISHYRGFNLALLMADFTKAYISCTWGVAHIGYVMICFGTGCALLSLILGYLVRVVGRSRLFVIAILFNVAIMMTLVFWNPDPMEFAAFLAFAFAWGACQAVWESQVAALNPILYPENRIAAYTTYTIMEYVGTAVGFAISVSTCMQYKLYVNMAILGAAAVSYGALEAGPLTWALFLPVKGSPRTEERQIRQENFVLSSDGR